jgi:hypothetical protein
MPLTTNLREPVKAMVLETSANAFTNAQLAEHEAIAVAFEQKLKDLASAGNTQAQQFCTSKGISYPTGPTS